MYDERCCIQILKCRVFLLLKMHKNVNINNKMLSLVFYRVIKAASIAEKNFITPSEQGTVLAQFCPAMEIDQNVII
jgi:hypothetical protein